jgi:hypothetical protein
MESEHNFSRYLVQCRSIADTMNQHLKGRIKHFFFFTTVFTFQKILLSTDSEPCDCKPLLSIAAHMLDTHLVPTLELSLDNNEEYWSLKDGSTLRAYCISTPTRPSLAGLPILSRPPTFWNFSVTIFGYTIFLNLVTET